MLSAWKIIQSVKKRAKSEAPRWPVRKAPVKFFLSQFSSFSQKRVTVTFQVPGKWWLTRCGGGIQWSKAEAAGPSLKGSRWIVSTWSYLPFWLSILNSRSHWNTGSGKNLGSRQCCACAGSQHAWELIVCIFSQSHVQLYHMTGWHWSWCIYTTEIGKLYKSVPNPTGC